MRDAVGDGAHTPHLKPAFDGLHRQEIVELARYALDYPETIPLWFGESDVVTDMPVRRKAIAALEAGETFYPDIRGFHPLRQAISGYIGRLAGTPIDVDRIMVTASGMAALNLSLNAIVSPGEEAIIVGPVWPNAAGVLTLAQTRVREVALEPVAGTGWRLDLDRIRDSITAKTRLLFINSPGNPTGWIADRETQRILLDLARAHGFWIVADEVYHRIGYEDDPTPSFLDICTDEDPVIVLNSFSKTWSMTGWRLGWLIAPARIVEKLAIAMEYMTSGVSTFSQHAGLVAIRDVERIAQDFRTYCADGRARMGEILGAIPRVRYTPPQGGFYAFFEVEGMTDSVTEAQRLVREHGVGLAPGVAFGPAFDSWFRLCFAQRPATLDRAGERLLAGLG